MNAHRILSRMKLELSLAAMLLITAVNGATAASRNDPATMINLWYEANEQCRGGSGDDQTTMDACDERGAYAKRLDQLGWCYGKHNQSGYQMKWHRCTKNSYRYNN
jgi:hypothetical protein